MQEEVEQKTIAFVVNGGKVTARTLEKIARFIINGAKREESEIKHKMKHPPIKHGKQSVKKLGRQNQGMTNIEITDQNIKCFEKYARKYGVDFALKKDKSVEPPKYIVFFKARDEEAISSAFKDFTQALAKKKDKPSVIDKLHKEIQKTKEMAKDLGKKLVKAISKGGHER